MFNLTETLDFHARFEVAAHSMLSPTADGRTENQDNFLVIDAGGKASYLHQQQPAEQQLANWRQGHCRFAILDGMGGHSFGREAAEYTVAGLLMMPPTTDLDTLSQYLDALHHRLHQQMHQHGAEPGCTLTLLEVPPAGPALLFHVGDSRLYSIDTSRIDCLTVDHVPATKFALHQLIDSAEWWHQTHVVSGFQISQAFVLGNSLSSRELFQEGLDTDLFALSDDNLPDFLQGKGDRRALSLQPGQTYVLASDGLWHLSQPLAFIDRWPSLLSDRTLPLAGQLKTVFEELKTATAQEPQLRGDNCTAIALRLR